MTRPPREFWIRWHEHYGDRPHVITDVLRESKYPDDLHVIEHEAFTLAISALRDIRSGKYKYYESHLVEPFTPNYFDFIDEVLAKLGLTAENGEG